MKFCEAPNTFKALSKLNRFFRDSYPYQVNSAYEAPQKLLTVIFLITPGVRFSRSTDLSQGSIQPNKTAH